MIRGPDRCAALGRLMSGLVSPLVVLGDDSWPETVRRDVVSALHKFMATMVERVNQRRGQTVLYLPSFDASSADPRTGNKDVTQLMESCIIHATRQVKHVLNKQDDLGDTSGPLQEVEFWRARSADLSGIRRQLDSEACRRIVRVRSARGRV